MGNPSRVVILGGAGWNGSKAVRVVVEDGLFSEVVIADARVEEVEKLAAELDSPKVKVSAKHIDAGDKESVVEILKGADVALNFIGPFYKYGATIICAAIDAKVNYVDICDDYKVTDEVLKMDEAAKDAGVTIISGIGTSPGVTQLVAKMAADKLDEVDTIKTIFFAIPAMPFGAAVYDHFFSILGGEVPIYRDGHRMSVPAFSEKETMFAPYWTPHGIEICVTGHPEPVTLPHYVKGVKEVVNKGGFIPAEFMEIFKWIIDIGLSSTEPIKVGDALIAPKDFIMAFLASETYTNFVRKKVEEAGIKPDQYGLRTRVVVSGKRNGKLVRYTYDTWTTGRETTYLTPVIAAEMIVQGKIKRKGVIAPEGVDSPQEILDGLAQRGFPIKNEIIEQTMP